MLSKEELIKRLRRDPMYREALKMAPTDAERRRIIATCEGFISNFVDSLVPGIGKINASPNLTAQLQEALKHGAHVIKESDGKPIVPEPEADG
jgi:hypothetical protein